MPDHRPTPIHLAWLLPLTVAFLSLGILLGRAADVWEPSLTALLLSALAALLSQGWRRSAAMLLAASALGALLGWQAYHPPLPEERNYQVHGTIAQELHLREDGQVDYYLPRGKWTHLLTGVKLDIVCSDVTASFLVANLTTTMATVLSLANAVGTVHVKDFGTLVQWTEEIVLGVGVVCGKACCITTDIPA